MTCLSIVFTTIFTDHDHNRRYKHHNRHHNDQCDDHNRVCPQSNAGQVHPSDRGEVRHTEPQLEREIQIVSDYFV